MKLIDQVNAHLYLPQIDTNSLKEAVKEEIKTPRNSIEWNTRIVAIYTEWFPIYNNLASSIDAVKGVWDRWYKSGQIPEEKEIENLNEVHNVVCYQKSILDEFFKNFLKPIFESRIPVLSEEFKVNSKILGNSVDNSYLQQVEAIFERFQKTNDYIKERSDKNEGNKKDFYNVKNGGMIPSAVYHWFKSNKSDSTPKTFDVYKSIPLENTKVALHNHFAKQIIKNFEVIEKIDFTTVKKSKEKLSPAFWRETLDKYFNQFDIYENDLCTLIDILRGQFDNYTRLDAASYDQKNLKLLLDSFSSIEKCFKPSIEQLESLAQILKGQITIEEASNNSNKTKESEQSLESLKLKQKKLLFIHGHLKTRWDSAAALKNKLQTTPSVEEQEAGLETVSIETAPIADKQPVSEVKLGATTQESVLKSTSNTVPTASVAKKAVKNKK